MPPKPNKAGNKAGAKGKKKGSQQYDNPTTSGLTEGDKPTKAGATGKKKKGSQQDDNPMTCGLTEGDIEERSQVGLDEIKLWSTGK